MKKFLVVIFAIVLIFAACGGNGNGNGSEEPNGANEPDAEAHTPSEADPETADPEAAEPEEEPEEEPAWEEEPVAEGAGIHGLLSRIEYGDNIAYIFGSMHASRPGWFPLAPQVEAAMARSDVFAFETDLVQMLIPSPETSARMMAATMLPEGQTLEDFLPSDIFRHFYAMLQTFEFITYEMVANLSPIAVGSAVLGEAAMLAGIDFSLSVDVYVLNFARANNRPAIGLNDLFHEFDLLFNVSDEIQFAAAAAFEDRDALVEGLIFLADAYEAQDIDILTEAVVLATIEAVAYDAYARHMHEVLIVQRSIEFAEEVVRLLQETDEPTTFFVTMGIGHMIGYDYGNVFVKFESLGFEVTSLY